MPLFPLRLRGWQGAVGCQGRRYLARRRREFEAVEAFGARGVLALNALAFGRADGTLRVQTPSHASSGVSLSAAWHSALSSIGRLV